MAKPTMEIAVEQEENSWEAAAAAVDDGAGLILQSVNLNSETEMNEVYEALNITRIGQKSRLRAYIQRLQTQQIHSDAMAPLPSKAYDVSFTILRNNKQPDGLRKLITQAAARNSGFYASNATTAQDLHNAAFQSKSVPEELDLSSWSQSGDDGYKFARLLFVQLRFLSLEKAATFEGEVIKLLQDRPSAFLVNTQENTLSRNIGQVCNMSPTVLTETPPPVHDNHYLPRQSNNPEEPFDSRDDCDLTMTVTATIPPGLIGSFNENDPLYPNHTIEKREAFQLFAEKAHIFPHNLCVKVQQKGGKRIKVDTNYEWLDNPTDADFNFLYLSPGMHLCFDGSGRGRGEKSATQAAICIEPLARTFEDGETKVKRFKIENQNGQLLATIPLRVWCRSEEVAEKMQSSFIDSKEAGFDEEAGLHYFENISVKCMHRMIPMGRESKLLGESGQRAYVYTNKVPFMDEQLSGAWSLNEKGFLSSTEIMEKCLLWSANQTWNVEWKGSLGPMSRPFESRTE